MGDNDLSWKKKIRRAHKLHRPSLKDWACDNFHKTFPKYVQEITDNKLKSYESFTVPDGMPPSFPSTSNVSNIPLVLNAKDLSPNNFAKRYETYRVPCVIRKIPQGYDGGSHVKNNNNNKNENDDEEESTHAASNDSKKKGEKSKRKKKWAAMKNWQFDELESNKALRNCYFKCGEDDDGNSINLRLKHFLAYLHNNKDDSPLYIFDEKIFDHYEESKKKGKKCSKKEDDRDKVEASKQILTDFTVPSYFQNDLFSCGISEERRPPYRWFLVGPERSGTTVHIDPLGTSAWNTLIVGMKRWVLFPPQVSKSIAKGTSLIRKDEDDEAIHYFTTILPRIKKEATKVGNNDKYKNFSCYEFTQHANETVYIPNGWWHAVLNLTHTVGVTQNYASEYSFNEVWVKTRSGRKRMAYKWLTNGLDVSYPHLGSNARAINKRDDFIMKYDPKNKSKKKEKKKKSGREKKKKIKGREERGERNIGKHLSKHERKKRQKRLQRETEKKSDNQDDEDQNEKHTKEQRRPIENNDLQQKEEESKPKRKRVAEEPHQCKPEDVEDDDKRECNTSNSNKRQKKKHQKHKQKHKKRESSPTSVVMS